MTREHTQGKAADELLADLLAADGPGSPTVGAEIERAEAVNAAVYEEETGMHPPVHEVTVTRLVTFIVDIEEMRKDRYDDDVDDDDESDPQQAAEDFVDGLEGADVDNYATIHKVALPPSASDVAP